MDPSGFAQGDSVKEARAKVKAPTQGSATYCGKGTGSAEVRKRYITLWSVNHWREIEKLDSSPRRVVSCTVELQKSEK